MGEQIKKIIKSKVVFKHETEAVWHTSNNGGPVEYIPELGEKVLYDPDENYSYTRIKYGDGVNIVANLPFSIEQVDWEQDDDKAADFIKNKPDIDGKISDALSEFFISTNDGNGYELDPAGDTEGIVAIKGPEFQSLTLKAPKGVVIHDNSSANDITIYNGTISLNNGNEIHSNEDSLDIKANSKIFIGDKELEQGISVERNQLYFVDTAGADSYITAASAGEVTIGSRDGLCILSKNGQTRIDGDSITFNNNVSFSGSYNDLTNKPELKDLTQDNDHKTVSMAEKETWNAKSNFSGSYNDLTNKPTIPTTTEQLTNNSDFATNKSVDDKLANLVDSAPEALNTLGELATAMQEYEDAYDALLETVGKKASREELVGQKIETGGEIFNDYESNQATGEYSHAEGTATVASGIASHAEGYNTVASGKGASSSGAAMQSGLLGSNITVSTDIDYAGDGKYTSSFYSVHQFEIGSFVYFVQSDDTNITYIYKVARTGNIGDGYRIWVQTPFNNAMIGKTFNIYQLIPTIASGEAAHAEGTGTTASGAYSHSGGHASQATGEQSFAHGLKVNAKEDNQVVFGRYNADNSNALFMIGDGTGDAANLRSNAFYVTSDGAYTKSGKLALDTSAAKIIDVTSLPTSDIKKNSFYRLEKGVFLENQLKLSTWNCIVVDTLPTTGTVVTTDMKTVTAYYNKADSTAYGYVNSSLATQAGVTAGWYPLANLAPMFELTFAGVITNINDDPSDGAYRLMLEQELYTYDVNGWTLHKSMGQPGTGDSAEIFNHPSNRAEGIAAHAEGYLTNALKNYTHAEGYGTTADGRCAHAEGADTSATGDNSHTEGIHTTAEGSSSHAEGYDTHATANFAHSEGENTHATQEAAHAEGYGTTASGYYAHAEGQETKASGNYTHSEGINSEAGGVASHVEGWGTVASGETVSASELEITDEYNYNYYGNLGANHAEGFKTKAIGAYSHAEGYKSKANRKAAHAEGWNTFAGYSSDYTYPDEDTSRGEFAHAEGQDTKAINYSAHAEGHDTLAAGVESHAGGYASEATGLRSFTHGFATKAKEADQVVFGKFNADNKDALFVVGNGEDEDNRSNVFEVVSNAGKCSIKVGNSELTETTLVEVDLKNLVSKLAKYEKIFANIDSNQTHSYITGEAGDMYLPEEIMPYAEITQMTSLYEGGCDITSFDANGNEIDFYNPSDLHTYLINTGIFYNVVAIHFDTGYVDYNDNETQTIKSLNIRDYIGYDNYIKVAPGGRLVAYGNNYTLRLTQK